MVEQHRSRRKNKMRKSSRLKLETRGLSQREFRFNKEPEELMGM
jgi:hypothetical protein